MLVLSRRIGERVVINDNIHVIVQRIHGNRITLAIEAPAEVPILRGELHELGTAASERQLGDHEPVATIAYRKPQPAAAPLRRRVAK